MVCGPCAIAAVSAVGAPIAIPGAIAGYIGYKYLSNNKERGEKKKGGKRRKKRERRREKICL